MRTVGDDATAVELASYTAFADADLLAEGIVVRLLAGISTRRYPIALEPVGEQVHQDGQVHLEICGVPPVRHRPDR